MRVTCGRLAIFLLCLLFSSTASAQTLTGRVVDPQGAAVGSADVRITSALLPAARTTRTAQDGTYAFDNVAPGRYSLRIESTGFLTTIKDVTVPSGGLAVPVSLQIAGLNEEVRVVADTLDLSLTKSDIPLRDQPMNVSTVTSDYLETFGINDLVEALATVPNVSTYQQYGVYEHYVYRGFSDDTQMVDGIRNENNRVRSQLSNVERIEVMKGPSAVLSGNDGLGTAVNIVLKKPSARPSLESSLSAGSWETMRLTAGATGPLGHDSLFYRVDFGVDSSENFRHDPWNKVNVTPSLGWRITRKDRLEARYSIHRNDVSGDSGIPIVTVDGVAGLVNVPRDRRYNTPQDFALSRDQSLRLQYTRPLGNKFGLRNVLGNKFVDDEYWVAESMSIISGTTDVRRTFLYFKHKVRPWENQAELNGSVTLGVPHSLLVGWTFQDYHSRTTRSNNANITTTPINLYDPVETHQTWTDFTISRYDHAQRYMNDFYLQDHAELGSKLKAVALFRGSMTRRSTQQNPVTNGVESEGTITRTRASKKSGRYGLVYQPISQLDVYGQYASSFKPNNNLQPDGTELKPEIGAQWELGQRFRFLDDHMYVNAAVFRIERQNVALSRPGGWYDQAGVIRSQGGELEVNGGWSNLSFTFGYGFSDAKYVDYVTTSSSGVQTVLSGKSRPRTPRNTVSYQAAHTWRNGLTVAVSGRTLGDQFLTDANTSYFESYSLANAAVSYRMGHLVYSVSATNLADTEYLASTRGNSLWYPGAGRRFLGSVRVLIN